MCSSSRDRNESWPLRVRDRNACSFLSAGAIRPGFGMKPDIFRLWHVFAGGALRLAVSQRGLGPTGSSTAAALALGLRLRFLDGSVADDQSAGRADAVRERAFEILFQECLKCPSVTIIAAMCATADDGGPLGCPAVYRSARRRVLLPAA